MHRRFALAAALVATALSLTADVAVAPREAGPSADYNFTPLIVADGSDFLVFWSAGVYPHFARIHGGVVSEGRLQKPTSVFAVTVAPDRTALAVCWDGSTVRIASIDVGGSVRMTDLDVHSLSSAAWNGSNLLIIDGAGKASITDETGTVLRSGMLLPQADAGWRAAKHEDGFIVLWNNSQRMYAATISPSGQLSPALAIAEGGAFPMAVGCDDSTTCLALYQLGSQFRGLVIRGVMGPSFALSSDSNAWAPAPPVWDGARFLVAWESRQPIGGLMDVHVTAVYPDGTTAPLTAISSSDMDSVQPAIATSATDTMVVWNESTHCSPHSTQIMARSLSTNRDLLLTHGLSSQSQPAIAVGTATSLIAWEETSDRVRIRARLFPFNAEAFDVASGPSSALPAIGTDGNGYLVAWQETLAAEGCRIAIRASLAGSGTAVTLGHDAYWTMRPQVSWNGSEYVVLWEQNDPRQLVAMRVDRFGQPIDSAPMPLTPPETAQDSYTSIRHDPAALLWTGSGYLLVWSRLKSAYIPWHSDPPPEFDVRTSVIGRDLVPAGLPQVVAPNAHDAVSTVRSGTVLALWFSGGTLHAVRLTTGGTLVSDRDLGIADEYPSAVVPTASGYAAMAGQEILYLAEDGLLSARQPIPQAVPGMHPALTSAQSGLALAYDIDGSVYLSITAARRRAAR